MKCHSKFALLAAILIVTGCKQLDSAKGKYDKIDTIIRDKKPEEQPADTRVAEVLPWGTWDNVTFLGMENIADAPVVMVISGVKVGGSSTTWTHDTFPNWPKHTGIKNDPNAVLNLAFKHEGRWYCMPTEWLLHGMDFQANKIYQSDRGNKKLWKHPFREYVVPKGTPCALFITDRWGDAGERSNVSEVFER